MAPPSRRPPPSYQRRRPPDREHSRSASSAALLPQPVDDPPRRKNRHSSSSYGNQRSTPREPPSNSSGANTLSESSLARLNALNEKTGWNEFETTQYRLREAEKPRPSTYRDRDRNRDRDRQRDRDRDRRYRVDKNDGRHRRDNRDHNEFREKKRVLSGPFLEDGDGATYNNRSRRRGGPPGGDDGGRRKKKRKKWCIIALVVVLLLVIIIGVAVGVSKRNSSSNVTPNLDSNKPPPPNHNLKSISRKSIPKYARGTYYDPFDWYDTVDFNLTFTEAKVGGLPIMGLNSTWNNNVRANPSVPPLTQSWNYGVEKVRGVNLGGWLSMEPFITPSYFEQFPESAGVVDEWTLSAALGPSNAAKTIEQHYSAFVDFQTFADIRKAGFDHVRIPYSYWAIRVYTDEPYVPMISWRYLLRGIEWARQNGLRVNLDLHGAPGSQNGWNHSGHQGLIGWLNGTDGTLNGQRTIDLHKQLGDFFGQPRYHNLVTMYGLVNEPRMVVMDVHDVEKWTGEAVAALRATALPQETILVMSEGFLAITSWANSPLQGTPGLLLDAHQYVIFNDEQLVLPHTNKIEFACKGWTQQTLQSSNPNTGFGNFLCGEWSQADTDCVQYLNDVGVGARWTGTMNTGNVSTSVLTPTCPLQNSQCNCAPTNADPSTYTEEYRTWLRTFAEAQMHSYEKGWGWFYWTWKTESAVQWSYELGMNAGILPTNVRHRSFNCEPGSIPDFESLGLSNAY